MKTKILLILIIGFIGPFISCERNNDLINEPTIDGTWSLKNVSGGLIGINIEYNEGDVYWIFSKNEGTLVVENSIDSTGPKNIFSGLTSGTYNFKIQYESDLAVLYINDLKRGFLIIEEDSFTMNDGIAADGFITLFVK